MNTITRNTIRADGQTVGAAMDSDAAFLRSVGIPLADDLPTISERRDAFQELVRDAVLLALDQVTEKQLRGTKKGWTDADLPCPFKALDNHSKTVFARSLEGFKLPAH